MSYMTRAGVEEQPRKKFEGVNMGINYFKREIKELYPNLPKKTRNALIKAYKKRSWMEFEAIVGRKMPLGPSRPKYGRIIRVSGVETQSYNYKIKVKVNGQK